MRAVITLWLLAALVVAIVILGEWRASSDACAANITTIAKDQSRVGG